MSGTVTTTWVCLLRDGRRIDLTGLTPEHAVAVLRALGVTTDQIDEIEIRFRGGCDHP